MDGIPPGSGRRKAARLVWEARRRAALGQTELSRISGIPLRTLTRIEAGEVVPRIDTVERLLLACGRTLSSEARRHAPDPAPDGPVAPNVSKALLFLHGGWVHHVVVGALAARLHGVAVEVTGVDVLIPDSERQRERLIRTVERLDRPFSRVPLMAMSTSEERFDQIRRTASFRGPVPSPVACLDDLIELEQDEARRRRIAALREERDRGIY